MSGRLLGNSCSLGLHVRYAFLVKVHVPDCQFIFSHVGFWSGYFFLVALIPDYCLLSQSFRTQQLLPDKLQKTKADFDWDYGKDYRSYHCSSIRTIVKLFCIGDRNYHYQRNPAHRYDSYHG